MTYDDDFGASKWHWPIQVFWMPQCKFEDTPANRHAFGHRLWTQLGGWESWCRVITGAPLPIHWGWMGHVFLGVSLEHRVDSPVGVNGGDWRYRVPDASWLRPCLIDDRACLTVEDMADLSAHEIDHGLGWGYRHRPFPYPLELRRAGAMEAVRESRGEHVPLPDRAVRPQPEVK